jgi:GT2 family glycosyltransferase
MDFQGTIENTPVFSIIVPTCGRVSLFVETMQSLAQQTYRNFEVIVPDDSRQHTDRAEIQEFVSRFQQETGISARYVHSSSPLYQAGNTNQGLRSARGKWIRILHSDDLLAPNALEFEWGLIHAFSGKVEVIFHWLLPFTQKPEFLSQPAVHLISPSYLMKHTLHSATSCPSGLLFSSSVLDEVKGMDEHLRFLCDWKLFFLIVANQFDRGNYLVNVQPGLCAWRIHSDNVTSKLWFDHFLEHKTVTQFMINEMIRAEDLYFNSKDISSFRNQAIVYRYSRLLSDFIKLPSTKKILYFNKIIMALLQLIYVPSSVISGFIAVTKRFLSKHAFFIARQLKLEPFIIDEKLVDKNISSVIAIRPGIPKKAIAASFTITSLFDNTFNLARYCDFIANHPEIVIFDINRNRFYEKIVFEILKYTTLHQVVSFAFEDNDYLTIFGLKALVEKLFPAQLVVMEQTQIGCNQHLIRFRRERRVPDYLSAPHDGWTFGLLTMGTRDDGVKEFISSIRKYCRDEYEIIVTTPSEIPWLKTENDVRQIVFSEKDDLGWITRKKNLICREARYSDIVICHDRFSFTASFFQWAARSGFAYGLAAPRLILPSGKRALDWAVVSSENLVWSFGGLLDYRAYSRYAYVPGGVTIIRKRFWSQFPWNENLYWNEHEDVELCRRAQRGGHVLTYIPGKMIAFTDRWVDHNKILPFDEHQEILFGVPVGEQIIRFLSKFRQKIASLSIVKRLRRWLIDLIR